MVCKRTLAEDNRRGGTSAKLWRCFEVTCTWSMLSSELQDGTRSIDDLQQEIASYMANQSSALPEALL
ncbi:hypothetical protein CF651_23940 [Paenibacillus rigui]|uniref:Uncharacterized protein n=1 Tax=Paenibacillus rigui TaxID=554312 RepID=A0A229UK98_9BACL|nr:hypothetical protein CF651_23940 [Paenibacillus rigui]